MKVRATALCFVGNGLRQPGDVFEYEGPMPDPHLEVLGGQSKPSPAKVEEEQEASAKRPRRTKKTTEEQQADPEE